MVMISIIFMITTGRDCFFLLYIYGNFSKALLYNRIQRGGLRIRISAYQSLRNSVRKVLGVIVGLLKDKACAEEKADKKRPKIEGYRSTEGKK